MVRDSKIWSYILNGKRDDGSYGCIDDLSFTYNGNQLKYIDNNGDGTHYTGSSSYQDNSDGTNEYAYDKNGNLVRNLDRNISSIQYNTLNLPTRITTKDQNTYEAEYTYDGQGRKLRATYQKKVMDIVAPTRPLTKTLAMSSRFEGLVNSRVRPETIIQDTIIHGVPIADYSEFSQTDYCGNIIYRGNRATVLNAHGYTNIDTDAATGESTATHYYYLKDHLGSNRVVFRGDGTVVQQNHYYAYGGLTAESTGGDVQTFKYNGKEFDRKLGLDLYDYGARWYDPVGSSAFTTIDPLCEEDYSVSPYVYCRNNPINAIDPDGQNPIYGTSGKFLGTSIEGFTGMIYVYKGSEELNFQEHSIDYWTNTESDYSYDFMTYDAVETSYPDETREKFVSNVMTDILRHFEGVEIWGKTFHMHGISDKRVSYEKGNNVLFTTERYSDNRLPKIIARGGTEEYFEGTIENFVSCMLIHEWYSHGVNTIGDLQGNHHIAYLNQIADPIFYQKKTPKFKQFIKSQLKYYTKKEL